MRNIRIVPSYEIKNHINLLKKFSENNTDREIRLKLEEAISKMTDLLELDDSSPLIVELEAGISESLHKTKALADALGFNSRGYKS